MLLTPQARDSSLSTGESTTLGCRTGVIAINFNTTLSTSKRGCCWLSSGKEGEVSAQIRGKGQQPNCQSLDLARNEVSDEPHFRD